MFYFLARLDFVLIGLYSDHGQRHCSKHVVQTYARPEHTVRRQSLFRI